MKTRIFLVIILIIGIAIGSAVLLLNSTKKQEADKAAKNFMEALNVEKNETREKEIANIFKEHLALSELKRLNEIYLKITYGTATEQEKEEAGKIVYKALKAGEILK